MHRHTFRLINETKKNTKDHTRIYECTVCKVILKEKKVNNTSYYFVENRGSKYNG